MVDREQAEHAMGLWRGGDRLLWRHTTPGRAEDDEQAVARALAHLERSTTMAGLVAASFEDVGGGEQGRWLEATCRTERGRLLNEGLVEDTACWRRAQALIAASQGRD
jgi:hypothetical protein